MASCSGCRKSNPGVAGLIPRCWREGLFTACKSTLPNKVPFSKGTQLAPLISEDAPQTNGAHIGRKDLKQQGTGMLRNIPLKTFQNDSRLLRGRVAKQIGGGVHMGKRSAPACTHLLPPALQRWQGGRHICPALLQLCQALL